MLKTAKIRSKKHLMFIASLPCIVSGATDVQAAHIRVGNSAGLGLKSGDDCTVPLSVREHALQHTLSEVDYWMPYGGHERATKLAKELYRVSGNREAAIELIMEWRS